MNLRQKSDYGIIWAGKISAAYFILYGFIKPSLLYVIGGVTVGLLTWLHWRAVGKY